MFLPACMHGDDYMKMLKRGQFLSFFLFSCWSSGQVRLKLDNVADMNLSTCVSTDRAFPSFARDKVLGIGLNWSLALLLPFCLQTTKPYFNSQFKSGSLNDSFVKYKNINLRTHKIQIGGKEARIHILHLKRGKSSSLPFFLMHVPSMHGTRSR